MNNNNSRPSINYSAVPSEAPDSTNDAPLSETTTQIHIDTIPNSAQQQQPRNEENPETVNSTSIDMEYPSNDETNDVVGATPPVHRNILTLFSEARSQFGRQTSTSLSHPHQRQEHVHEHFERGADNEGQMANSTRPISFNQSENTSQHSPHSPTTHSRNIRSWRMNLNNVLSFSSASSTEAIRSLITSSGSFRYAPLNTNETGDNIHVLLNQDPPQPSRPPTIDESLDNTFANSSSSRVSRSNSLRNENNPTLIQNIGPSRESIDVNRGENASHDVNNSVFSAMVNGGDTSVNVQQDNNPAPAAFFSNRNQNTTNRNASQEDDENNVISDIFVKVLSHFVRYLPFICILFVKFVHDHLLGILDLVLLHGIMYQVNKSLREQVAKFSQKKYGILFRDFGLVLFVVSYRFLLASSSPDPFGLMISPPSEGVTLELTDAAISNESKKKLTVVLSKYLGNNNPENDQQSTTLENTVTITKAISLGVLLYYVAVNDLILKLITILIKISITLMPTKIIRHKPRARMFVLVEYTSQFYRALAPVRQWLMFLFESYSGLEVISGILFSSFYMGAKGFEFVERGKSFRKALINFLRNMDYERKPTRDELDAAGSLCPICHDAYTTPVVLECGHIFCDDCVSTWFKREQTCPMCRAKVSEDPTWQDGSTSFFYQLC